MSNNLRTRINLNPRLNITPTTETPANQQTVVQTVTVTLPGGMVQPVVVTRESTIQTAVQSACEKLNMTYNEAIKPGYWAATNKHGVVKPNRECTIGQRSNEKIYGDDGTNVQWITVDDSDCLGNLTLLSVDTNLAIAKTPTQCSKDDGLTVSSKDSLTSSYPQEGKMMPKNSSTLYKSLTHSPVECSLKAQQRPPLTVTERAHKCSL